MAPTERAVVFVDNHDNQRAYGGSGDTMIYKSGLQYIWASVYTLAYNYGFTR